MMCFQRVLTIVLLISIVNCQKIKPSSDLSVIVSPADPVLNGPLSMTCLSKFRDLDGGYRDCLWVGPGGRIVRDDNRDRDTKIKTGRMASFNGFSCKINLSSLKSVDLGRWTCRMLPNNESIPDLEAYEGIYTSESDRPNYRLPRHLMPSNYRISVALTNHYSFSGSTDMTLRVVRSSRSNNVTLHATENLNIDLASTRVIVNGNERKVLGMGRDNMRQFLVVTFAGDNLRKGDRVEVHLEYEGRISSEGLTGLYHRFYKDGNTGKMESIYMTQLQPVHARSLFPCLDEPDLKATFDLEVGRPEGYTSLSNMPKIPLRSPRHDENGNYNSNLEWDAFETTPIMSTYLFALVVSKYSYNDATKSDSKKQFRIWSRPQDQPLTKFAADVTPRIYEHLSDLTRVYDPVPKEDLIALPAFRFLGMENWGLMTFKESGLLDYPRNLSKIDKSRHKAVSALISHELSHVWFGNLVTMSDWSNIWLNEGFANHLEHFAVHDLYPELNMDVEHQKVDVQAALERDDDLDKSRPIVSKADTPDEIKFLFNDITYGKSGAVIRMFRDVMGEDAFWSGLREYLDEYKYDNVGQEDLFRIMEKHSRRYRVDMPANITLTEAWRSWTSQAGYPVISVIVNRFINKLVLTQKSNHEVIQPRNIKRRGRLGRNVDSGVDWCFRHRCRHDFWNPEYLDDDGDTKNNLWYVPIRISYFTDQEKSLKTIPRLLWLTSQSQEYDLESLGIPDDAEIVLNRDAVGFYRVDYESEAWSNILRNEDALNQVEQIQIGSDRKFLKRVKRSSR